MASRSVNRPSERYCASYYKATKLMLSTATITWSHFRFRSLFPWMGPSSCKQFLVKLTFSYKPFVFHPVIITFTDKQQCCIICKKRKSRNTIIYKYSAKSPPEPGRVRGSLVWGGRPQPGSAWPIMIRKKTEARAWEDVSDSRLWNGCGGVRKGSLTVPRIYQLVRM